MTHDTMSHGNPDRARALRQYRKLRSDATYALTLAEHPRTGLDTAMRLRWQADEWAEEARDLDTEWGFTPHGRAAAIA